MKYVIYKKKINIKSAIFLELIIETKRDYNYAHLFYLIFLMLLK